MAKTYAQLAKEIESLTKAAAAIRQKEIPAVVARLKEAIETYGLTAQDLGLTSDAAKAPAPSKPGTAAVKAARPAKPAKKAAGTPTKVPVKYRDADGHSWTGRGSKPGWLQAAMAAGQPLESFLVDSDGGAAPSPAADERPAAAPKPGSATKSKARKATPAAKYKDDAGHSWSGFGPKPGWLKDALANGKTLEELAA